MINNPPASLPWTLIRKAATQTVNNSAALINDLELLLPVAINDVFEFTMVLRVLSNAAADIQYDIIVPAAGALFYLPADRIGPLAAMGMVQPRTEGLLNTMTTGGGWEEWITLQAIYIGGANAGNIQLRWSQRVATVVDTQVLENSFLRALKLN